MKVYNGKDASLEIKFSKVIKAILGNQFIQKDIEEDIHKGTDFLIFNIKPFRCACRLRRFDYIKYKSDFTIRWSRPSGVKTEYRKIIDGYVDYFLYGFINKDETKIIHYFIADLDIFRKINPNPKSIKPNNPHDSELAIFSINQFPNNFIIKSYSK